MTEEGENITLKNKVLVVGHKGVGKLQLVQELCKILDSTSQPISDTTPQCVPLSLATKYYTADIVLWVDTLEPTADGASAIDSAELRELGEAVDGFIYVYDRDKSETFEPLRSWTTFLDDVQPNVALCVANTVTEPTRTAAETPVHLQNHEEFCLEHGMEFIDLYPSLPEERDSTDEITEDEIMAERVGVDRIAEALENNMWDGMVRGTKSTTAKPTSNGSAGIDKANLANAAEDSIRRLLSMMEGADGGGSDAEEVDDDDFERSLRTLQTLREHGKTLSDSERRALAAQFAMSLGVTSSDDEA
ncbi:uncharacterized protein EV422DRAFT_567128 [Fimicolochytrium jonesii]|uniref:uncharacterized protein n=1 Tax=Fimicolochytrium jonesii TaxID=1396493 RepID=UPI0022FF3516|nr:uncharacterized protein EV422DRAFT_567128 [Fimicolochytrium jonesii]KAI8821387.1 hypothetical protein EV422DRAFT_567128 [Fimicolochytrium jonesii]